MQFLIGRPDLWDIFSISLAAKGRLSRKSCRNQRFDFLRGTDKSGREISLLRIVREPSCISTMELKHPLVSIAVMYLIQALFVLRKFDPEIDRTLQTYRNRNFEILCLPRGILSNIYFFFSHRVGRYLRTSYIYIRVAIFSLIMDEISPMDNIVLRIEKILWKIKTHNTLERLIL